MLQLPDWPSWAIRTFVLLAGFTLCIWGLQVKLSKNEDGSAAKPNGERLPSFRAFQRQYLVVYTIIMTADWLQGTNMYTLYQSYNVDISTLFLTGFMSSAIFGTVVGLYVDRWGRRLGCIVYLLIEIVVNVFEHFDHFPLLMLGRVLGGVSTSLLFSAFESWMVSEHRKKGFPEEWLADTFSTASFLCGSSAVFSGILAQVIADQLGEIGPFQAAIALTVLALLFVVFWDENYGGTNSDGEGAKTQERSAFQLILSERKVLLLGLVNSLFEGSKYSFVFMWVPTMITALAGAPLPTGLVFSCLMVCISLGGLLFSPAFLLSMASAERIAIGIFLVSATALAVPVFRSDIISILGSFCIFEICVGAFDPCAGLMRSKVIPDAQQGSVMNIFRIPLNVLVVVGTKLTDVLPAAQVFSIIVIWLLLGAGLQVKFDAALVESTTKAGKAQ